MLSEHRNLKAANATLIWIQNHNEVLIPFKSKALSPEAAAAVGRRGSRRHGRKRWLWAMGHGCPDPGLHDGHSTAGSVAQSAGPLPVPTH